MGRREIEYCKLVDDLIKEIEIFLNNEDKKEFKIEKLKINKILNPISYNILKTDDEKSDNNISKFNIVFLIIATSTPMIFLFSGVLQTFIVLVLAIIALFLVVFLLVKKAEINYFLKKKEELKQKIVELNYRLEVEKRKSKEDEHTINSLQHINDILIIIKENIE